MFSVVATELEAWYSSTVKYTDVGDAVVEVGGIAVLEEPFVATFPNDCTNDVWQPKTAKAAVTTVVVTADRLVRWRFSDRLCGWPSHIVVIEFISD
mmetsp:Transcript_8792/g.18260  ORF Transcript_8792/g.18260 Transcript_8792/m.18260 type:complete len:96 (-) Transcript_8792:153-440(-)